MYYYIRPAPLTGFGWVTLWKSERGVVTSAGTFRTDSLAKEFAAENGIEITL